MNTRLELLQQEQQRATEDLRQLNRLMHRIMFVVITSASAAVAFLVKGDHEYDFVVLKFAEIAVAQFVVLLSLFAVLILAGMNVYGAYLVSLEREINSLVDHPVTVWESGMAGAFFWSPSSVSFWLIAVIATFSGLLVAYMIITGDASIRLKILVLVEALAVITALVFLLPERRRARRHADMLLSADGKGSKRDLGEQINSEG